MDNIDDAETAAKISDSAYSNSCSNSQSRRSHSSKSTHSGSNSSGSSGYGGKASTSGSSNALGQPPKKDKESKKKKLSQTEVKAAETTPADEALSPPEPAPILATPKEDSKNVDESCMAAEPEKVSEAMDISLPETTNPDKEAHNPLQPVSTAESFVTSQPPPNSTDKFSCVISMHDGVVMYSSESILATLGYTKESWIGRSFIDYIHPADHKTFSSLITNGLAFPKLANGKIERGRGQIAGSTMVCRLRRYRSLNSSFGIKDFVAMFTPFLLKFFFKDHNDDDVNVIYLVIQATHYSSAYKTPNELVPKPVSFVLRHGADGILEFIDPESAPYLGYLPQDIADKNALHLYHPDDLHYLRNIYEIIVKEGKISSSRPYRLMAQNGDYVKVETEWSSVINPWSMKLEFVIAKHHILEGPTIPDVFLSPRMAKTYRISGADLYKIQAFRDSIINIMKEVRPKPGEAAKQQINKRGQDLAAFMETLIEETPKQDDDMPEVQDRDHSYCERDSEMLGGISPHHDSDSKSSIETPLSYNQLNYNENLQRYFDSQGPLCIEGVPATERANGFRPGHVVKPSSRTNSPMAQISYENEMSSNSSAMAIYVSSPGPPSDRHYVKLSESMIHKISRSTLNRHNAEMERELVKTHRESRSSKGEREKASNETRKKKKEHLARCNASFHPTSAGDAFTEYRHRQGVKRPSKPQHNDAHAHKHHCPSPRETRRRPFVAATPPLSKPSATINPSVAPPHWPSSQNVNGLNMFGVGIPQQMPMLTQHAPTIPVASSTHFPITVPTSTHRVTPIRGTSMPTTPRTSASVPVSGVAGFPIVSGIPTVPGMLTVPGIPTIPGIPTVAGMPTVPGIPTVPGMPTGPGIPTVPIPRPDIFPGSAGMRAIPCTSGERPMSAAYGMPTVPGIPTVPGMPTVPGIPTVPITRPDIFPGSAGMGAMPCTSGESPMSAAYGMPTVPGIPTAPGIPTVPIPRPEIFPGSAGIGAMPCTSGERPMSAAYGMPTVPGIPTVPIPRPDIFPGSAGMEAMPCTSGERPMSAAYGMPTVPGIPTDPGIPTVPTPRPDIFPGSAGMGAMPCTSGERPMSAAYGMPTVPGMPTGPGIPTVPIPRPDIFPGSDGMGAMPCTSGERQVSAAYGGHMHGPSAVPSASVMPSMCHHMHYNPGTNTTPSTSRQEPCPFTSGYHQPIEPSLPYTVTGHPISMASGHPVMYPASGPEIYPPPTHCTARRMMEQKTSALYPLGRRDNNFDPSAEFVTSSSSNSMCGQSKTLTSDDNADKTDGESSYSSFYSSFFKTDSSADDSSDQNSQPNELKNRFWMKAMPGEDAMSDARRRRFPKKKKDAPWNQEVLLTPELIYKYQLATKPIKEVLEEDRRKILAMKIQSSQVSEQLGQLYLDLQLQGVAARLTLEEGITSSSSSGEEVAPLASKTRRKREFNKLVIIHEEDAPLPTPDSGFLVPESATDEDEISPSSTTS